MVGLDHGCDVRVLGVGDGGAGSVYVKGWGRLGKPWNICFYEGTIEYFSFSLTFSHSLSFSLSLWNLTKNKDRPH